MLVCRLDLGAGILDNCGAYILLVVGRVQGNVLLPQVVQPGLEREFVLGLIEN